MANNTMTRLIPLEDFVYNGIRGTKGIELFVRSSDAIPLIEANLAEESPTVKPKEVSKPKE